MSEATFTFRVEEALKTEFADAARQRDRTGAQLLRDFMRDYVRQQRQEAGYDEWFRQQVQTGLTQASTGQLLANDEVRAKFAAMRDTTRRKLGANA